MEDAEILIAEVDGKRVEYTAETTFLVQVGTGKSSYQTRYAFTGDLAAAVEYYNGINIGRGGKKRLVMPKAKDPVLAKASS